MTQATETRSLVMEKELAHPPEKVWRALTEGSLLEQWMMKNDFEPVVGHKFTFRMPPMPNWNGIVDCEVLTVEPYERLSYRWNTQGGPLMVVNLTLTKTDGGVLLRMEQTGFPAGDQAAYGGAQYGWNGFLGRLPDVVARA